MKLTSEQLKQIIKEEIEAILSEDDDVKKDACYKKIKAAVKRKGGKWPSAYASGRLVQCRDVGAANWREGEKKDESLREAEITDKEEEELEDVKDQLRGAVKAHGKQADTIDKALKNEVYMHEATYEDGSPVEENFSFIENMNEDELEEAVYNGKKVPLNKPMRGDVKKFKVYVNSGKKDSKGRIKAKKVNFGHGGSSAKRKGEKTMKIRKSNPKARKNFRARHNCDNPGPKTKARYWSCRKW